MKATGIVRKIDELGRVVIPAELRKTLDIKDRDSLEVFVDGERVVLRKYAPGCICCGSLNNNLNRLPNGRMICEKCRRETK